MMLEVTRLRILEAEILSRWRFGRGKNARTVHGASSVDACHRFATN